MECFECKGEATIKYQWPWGEVSGACDEHLTLVQTRAGQLGCALVFLPLGAVAGDEAPDTPSRAEQVNWKEAYNELYDRLLKTEQELERMREAATTVSKAEEQIQSAARSRNKGPRQ